MLVFVERPSSGSAQRAMAEALAALHGSEATGATARSAARGERPLLRVPAAAAGRVVATLDARVTRLEHRWKQTPAKVTAAQLTGSSVRATMNTDRRNLVNAIKIATYNAERWLARRFFRHYTDPRDWLTIFRSVLQLSGRVMVDGTGGLRARSDRLTSRVFAERWKPCWRRSTSRRVASSATCRNLPSCWWPIKLDALTMFNPFTEF